MARFGRWHAANHRLPLLDGSDQVAFAHTAVPRAELTGKFPQLGEHHAGQAGPLARCGAVGTAF